MQPMIGLPSGLERVRWKPSAVSLQPSNTPRILAPRVLAYSYLSNPTGPAPSATTKPSRFLENGLDAVCGTSLAVESADNSEKRMTISGLIEPSVPMHRAVSVSPRRMASTPTWMALAPDAQAVESEIGEPLVPNFSATWSATEPKRKRR